MHASAALPQEAVQPRWTIIRALLALDMVALIAMYLSGQWDQAEHAKGAVDTFWYAPHYGIYFGLLVTALLSLASLALVLRAPGLLVEKLGNNAALVLIAIANGLNFSGAPFDAWWHATFGLDLTVWSPPHLHLLLGTILTTLGCAVYFLDDAPLDVPLQLLRAIGRRRALAILTLTLSLLVSVFLFYEYEKGSRISEVLARPRWMYPLFWSGYALFMLTLCASATRSIGMASLVAALYGLARLAVLGFDRAVLDYQGIPAYPLIIPALALDLALARLWPRWGEGRPRVVLAVAGLLAASILAITAPPFWTWLGVSPDLNAAPWQTYWPVALLAGLVGTFAGWWCGTALRRLRPSTQLSPSVPVESPMLAQ